jgi:hypothetical protein
LERGRSLSSLSFQGYMEGALRTGEVAARRIMRSLGLSPLPEPQGVNNPQRRRRNNYLMHRFGFSNDLTELED